MPPSVLTFSTDHLYLDNLPGDGPYTVTATVTDGEGGGPVTGYDFVKTFGSGGNGDGQFMGTSSVAVDSSGNVWATDYGNSRIEEFTNSGTFLKSIGVGQLNHPDALIFDASGDLWVADNWNNRIAEFQTDGTLLQAFGSGYLLNGVGYLAFGRSGHVYANDANYGRVVEFKTDGTFVKYIGQGQLNYPYGLAVDSSGYLWVADGNNDRVVKFDESGNLLETFGTPGNGNGQFNTPVYGLAFDPSGNLWVDDSGNSRIQEFDVNSNFLFLRSVGSYGTGDGQFVPPTTGITVDSSGNLWVADTYNNRVQEFAPVGGPATASTSVVVKNVAPTMTISGAETVDEGSVYTLTLGPVVDPGADTVSQYVIHWGDSADQTIPAPALPANRQVTHTYADGPTSPTITVDLTDEDGTYLGVASKAVTVDNVAPTVEAGSDQVVNEGDTVSLGSSTAGFLRTLANPRPDSGDAFGHAAALVGNNALVGARGEGGGAGAAYLFDGESGTLLGTFENPRPGYADLFGFPVAAMGNNLLVGASTGPGAAYLIDPSSGQVLRTFDSPAGGFFAKGLAAVGNNVLIGAPTAGGTGAAYLFDSTTNNPSPVLTFTDPTPNSGDYFGYATAVWQDKVLVGANYDDAGGPDVAQSTCSIVPPVPTFAPCSIQRRNLMTSLASPLRSAAITSSSGRGTMHTITPTQGMRAPPTCSTQRTGRCFGRSRIPAQQRERISATRLRLRGTTQ